MANGSRRERGACISQLTEHSRDAGFIIHTHQTYATAVGLAGYDSLDMTDDERQKLGGIALAGYGLSGTKKLTSAVTKALETGAQTILMVHHGVLICGRERDEAMRARCAAGGGMPQEYQRDTGSEEQQRRSHRRRDLRREAYQIQTQTGGGRYVRLCGGLRFTWRAAWRAGMDLVAQIDDMAQMIGRKIPDRSGSE